MTDSQKADSKDKPMFTPGPWKINEPPFGYTEITLDDADLDHPATVICEIMDGEHEEAADAALISAAPDMYEAGEDALATIKELMNTVAGDHGHDIAMVAGAELTRRKLMAALAKARGQ